MSLILMSVCTLAEILLADPSIVREATSYFLVGTEPAPNSVSAKEAVFPVLKSNDLKTWNPLDSGYPEGRILPRNVAFGKKFFWAPQLFARDGKHYFAYTCEHGWGIAMADRVEGPYRHLATMAKGRGRIDPFVLQDDDGSVYAYCSDWNLGGISAVKLKPDMSGFDGEPTLCVKNTESWEKKPLEKRFEELNAKFGYGEDDAFKCSRGTIEGPTVVKRRGKYVLFYSANDYRSPDYCVGAAVSDTPTGPWKKLQSGPVLSQAETGFNGTGHGDVFDDNAGNLWYVFHAHNSGIRIHPRRAGMIRLVESVGADGYPRYAADPKSMKLL